MTDDRVDLSSLDRETAPPPELERALVRSLRRAGFLRTKPLLALGGWAAAAVMAGIALFLYVHPPSAARSPSPQYILLLYESPQFRGGSHSEYAAWARRQHPRIVGGEELAQPTVTAIPGASTPLPSDQPRFAGYFLIDAPDDAAAVELARACPHVRHGGSVVLRRITR
ncbi:MAG: hypothetical protein JO197_18325 [Acidobacteria bacterium]|nr:hypothetical protein [Acidobacteriota bacterium]MBV9479061.1 hypothetical protein [Acidobacteriota bacterium]